MGRSTVSSGAPMLKNSDQNIGNSTTLLPQVGAPTVIPVIGNAPSYQRLLDLSGGSDKGQSTSVVYTASRVIGSANPYPGFAGPITGIIEFGNGGRSTRAEFDIPVGPFVGSITQAQSAIEPQDSGVIITVPTSVVRAYVRYDNLLLAPVLNGAVPPQYLAQIKGVPARGPGGPVQIIVLPPTSVPAEPISCKAMAAYFSRPTGKVYKTLYCYLGVRSGGGVIAITIDDGAGSPALYALPPFTRKVKILRNPITSALVLSIYNGINLVDQVAIAANTSPEIKIYGNQNIIGVQSATANPGDAMTLLAVACEIGI
jgi:hypothetical protein